MIIQDRYAKAVDVVPSDSVNFVNQGTGRLTCDALYCGTAGNLVTVAEDGTVQTWAVVAGQTLKVQAKRVNSTSTTTTGIKALYAL
jgi:hypothetical protein